MEATVNQQSKFNVIFLGVSLCVGLGLLGLLLGNAAISVKEYERSVTVKGLAEQEFEANIVIWPIKFSVASNNLGELYRSIDTNTQKIRMFLEKAGVKKDDISISAPAITDKSAQQYGGNQGVEFRYSALQTVTVYSDNIKGVREVMGKMSELGQQGIVFTGDYYQDLTEYIFTRLNEVKPEMIEEATRNAREVAEKFASDSNSKLGKIKRASQGQFSISSRDRNNPHIKNVRVVSTITYYLSD